MANPAEDIEDEVPEAPDPAAEARTRDEDEAYRMGWRPYEEYRGPPGQWRTAKEFLERGQKILPIVRKDLEKQREINANMQNEIKALRSTVDEQRQVMDDLLKMARTADERGYSRAMDELKAQKAQAAREGNIEAVVAIQDKIDEVREERAASQGRKEAAKAAPKVEPKQDAVPPEVQQFVRENPWFNTDPVLTNAMRAEHVRLLEEDPDLTLTENLQAAKDILMERYPRKFGITPPKPKAAPQPEPEEEEVDDTPEPAPAPKRRVAAVSAPSAPAGNVRAKATGIASIEDPQERQVAQQAFARAKRQIPELTEGEWFAIYQDPKRDVLEVMRAKRAK